jgi:hypothetical protein
VGGAGRTRLVGGRLGADAIPRHLPGLGAHGVNGPELCASNGSRGLRVRCSAFPHVHWCPSVQVIVLHEPPWTAVDAGELQLKLQLGDAVSCAVQSLPAHAPLRHASCPVPSLRERIGTNCGNEAAWPHPRSMRSSLRGNAAH